MGRDHTRIRWHYCPLLARDRPGQGTARPSVAHRHADHHPHREVGVLVQDARYSVPLARSHLEALEPRYPGGRELGYRHRGRGRHRRYPGPKPATTDRCTRPEVAEIRIQPFESSSTCPAGTVVVVAGPGRPLVRRVRSAAEMPTRRQIRHCVVAKPSLHIFSRLPSAWESYDSCNGRELDSARWWRPWQRQRALGSAEAEHGGRNCLSASE